MQRLTWTGIAMHADHLPGYPASHGCVRLLVDFAEKLYSVTLSGTSVIITDHKFAPGETAEPGRLLSGKTGAPSKPTLAAGRFEWHPKKSPTGPVSVIFSIPDQQAYVYRNGIEIGRAAISTTGLTQDFGSHVYSALDKVDPNGRREWMSTASFGPAGTPDIKELAERVTIPGEFLEQARTAVSPGTTLIITDVRVSAQTHSAPSPGIAGASRDARHTHSRSLRRLCQASPLSRTVRTLEPSMPNSWHSKSKEKGPLSQPDFIQSSTSSNSMRRLRLLASMFFKWHRIPSSSTANINLRSPSKLPRCFSAQYWVGRMIAGANM